MANKNKKDTNKNNDFDRSYSFKIIVITLLIIIIILLLLNSCDGLTKTNRGEYTGNYDIYQINLKGTCECPTCETCDKSCASSTVSKNDSTSTSKPSTDYEPTEDTGFIVYDKDDKWSETGEETYTPSIFRHSSYEVVDGLIAPGVQNVYKFIVRNLNDFSVKYTIKAIETNTANINMKYRLRSETGYVIGSDTHWVDGSDIITSLKSLSAKGRDTYYLDWKWFDDDIHDTPIGIDDTASYSIYLKVEAEEE